MKEIKVKNINKLVLTVFVIITSLIVTACSLSPKETNNTKALEVDGFAMGTVISQKLYGENAEGIANEANEKVKALEKLLTFNAPEGDIFKLNENAGKVKVELTPDTIKILNKAQEVSRLSNGAFDVTIGPLVKSWGIGTKQEHIPTKEELQKLIPLTNYKDLILESNSAFLKRTGQMVDLGGIAKGYAGDVVKEIYKANGIKSGYVSLGGNVVVVGNKPDGSQWSVGVRNPRPTGDELIGVVKVTDQAVVTAGDDQRFFESGGERYHHILNPTTGYPARSDLMSVTLITDSSLEADAFDTAVFILGLKKGKELIKQYGGIEAVFITVDKKVHVTDGLKDSFIFLDESKEYEYVK